MAKHEITKLCEKNGSAGSRRGPVVAAVVVTYQDQACVAPTSGFMLGSWWGKERIG